MARHMRSNLRIFHERESGRAVLGSTQVDAYNAYLSALRTLGTAQSGTAFPLEKPVSPSDRETQEVARVVLVEEETETELKK